MGLVERRIAPLVGLPPGQAVVDAQLAERADARCVSAGQPMDHVDVVGPLLQQQAGRVLPLGVPVAEVCVAAVADEVPAPDGLDLPDLAGLNDGLHLLERRHVSHVVADEQAIAVLACGVQEAVAVFDGDREGLFHVDGHTGLQGGHPVLGMQEVRRADEDGIEVLLEQLAIVARRKDVLAVGRLSLRERRAIGVADSDDPRSLSGPMGLRRHPSPASRANDADPQISHRCNNSPASKANAGPHADGPTATRRTGPVDGDVILAEPAAARPVSAKGCCPPAESVL